MRRRAMRVVVSAKNGTRDFECEPGEKILHAGLRSGVELPYECATGTCGTCKARLTSGRTESQWAEAPGRKYFKSEGDLLTCQSVAHDDCALEVGPLKSREPNTSAPRALGGVVRGFRRLTHDVVAFDVDIDAPLDFAAGQFALITIPGIPGARAYSMVNFDRGAERLSFVVKKKPGGAVSEWLFGDGVDGARLVLFAPLGHATFHPEVKKHVLCVAGGSGIAGMMSILSLACREGHFAAWDGHVFFRVRTARRLLPRRAGRVPRAVFGAARGDGGALRRGRSGVAGRRLSGVRVRARVRPRRGGRAHEGTVRRRPRLRGGTAADGGCEPAPAAARG